MPTRRRVLQGLAGTAAAMALPGQAFAAGWPERPVKLIVPFAPGGNTDGIARIIGNYLSEKLGETFVVDNRPGAGGIVAADALAKASPDGYTMLMVALPQVAIVPVLHKVHYDPVKDFAPICDVASNPFCMVANRELAGTHKQIEVSDDNIILDSTLTYINDRKSYSDPPADPVSEQMPVKKPLQRGWQRRDQYFGGQPDLSCHIYCATSKSLFERTPTAHQYGVSELMVTFSRPADSIISFISSRVNLCSSLVPKRSSASVLIV